MPCTSVATVTMPVHISSALASNATVDVYIDAFDPDLGTDQGFNGLLLARDVPLDQGLESGSQDQFTATAKVNLSQSNLSLLPIEYYLYAVVRDGTNTPVTSTLTSDGEGGFLAGVQGHGSSISYAASKAAVNCMTKSLARAFGPKVRVNAVAPGPVLTRWLAGHDELVERSVQMTPLQRAATPDDVADVIEFLALGNSLVTGQVVVVDGGRTM